MATSRDAHVFLSWFLIFIFVLRVILPFDDNFTSWYLQVIGFVGLLVPCVWSPMFLGLWERTSHHLSEAWGAVGVKELDMKNPFYKEELETTTYAVLMALWSTVSVSIAIFLMFLCNILIMYIEVTVQTAPLCGSWFDETVWNDYVYVGGEYASESKHPYAKFSWPPCYPGNSESPFDVNVTHGYPWRGLMIIFVGITEGILIGVVYAEVFTCFAEKLAVNKNKKYWQDHERMIVNFTYPFEAGSTIFYFWVLCFMFIPLSGEIQGAFAANRQSLTIDFNASKATAWEVSHGMMNMSAYAPCPTIGDGVCDEWDGTCMPSTDIDDCFGWGCSDPNATNFNPNVTRPTDEFNQAYPSLIASTIPETLLCNYTQFVGSTPKPSTCKTHNDGQCDEPLRCFLQVMHTEPEELAIAMYAECLAHTTDDPSLLGLQHTCALGGGAGCNAVCKIGSDVDDCQGILNDMLTSCASGSGCMAALRHQFNEHACNLYNHTQRAVCVASQSATPQEVCNAAFGQHAQCSSFPGTWPASTNLPVAQANATASLVTAIKCRTPAALQCVARCEECAACLIDKPVGTIAQAAWAAQTPFCNSLNRSHSSYVLCTRCEESCQLYKGCFSSAVQTRASAGAACDRMGRTNNGWCDERKIPSGCTVPLNPAWACPAGEDVADCQNSVCNFGCKTESDTQFDAVAKKHLPSACTGSLRKDTKSSEMVKLWLYDKRFKNQVGDMITVPLTLSLFFPLLFEFLMPSLCACWQRTNRRPKRPNVKRLNCCARCCCWMCHCCRCCIVMCNCFMCDEDAKRVGKHRKSALPELEDASDNLDPDKARQKADEKLRDMLNEDREEMKEDMKKHMTEGEKLYLEDEITFHVDRSKSELDDPLDKADELIIESMLDPLDLPNEYRKICIILLLTAMWTIVMPFMPVIGWIAITCRYKVSTLDQLSRYARSACAISVPRPID